MRYTGLMGILDGYDRLGDDFESRLAAGAATVARSCPAYFLTDQDRVVGHRGELKRLRPRRRHRWPRRDGLATVIPLSPERRKHSPG